MRFGVLGPLAVWTDDGRPVHVPEPKVRALLADLLVARGRPVPSDRLVDDLWGERPPRNPTGTLQARISQLRAVLDGAEPGARALVAFRPPGYALEASDVDAARFEELTVRAGKAADPGLRASLLVEALDLWRGEAFADVADAAFARAAITDLEERRLAALEDLAWTRLELGEHALAASELAGPVAHHPLRERLRAAYMKALYLAGRQGEALAAYQDLRERLAEELGVDPGPEAAALHQAILLRDPALAPRPATVPEAAAPSRTNLPEPLSDLVGRDEAIKEARDALATSRLVTLTGPGGVGKTRLALAVAADPGGPPFPDGVWLAELAAVPAAGSAGVLGDAVAGVLGLRDDSLPGDPVERLAEALRGRRMLLVLDNCEHVIGPAAELAVRLLASAPGLRVLATGREPLGIEGERLLAVPPLEHAGAVELFTARAAAAAPGFTVDDPAAVAMICRRLDGIPLALELAATRVRALGVRELAGRLDDRFRVLSSGRRDAPARQRTLRAVIDWSWELLDGPERLVLRRLAVHADGCALEAAERICAEPGVDVLDVLARLVDRSLVTVVRDGSGGTRYRLLESVAAYGLERLEEAGEGDAVRRRHARHYAGLAGRGTAGLRGPDQRQWLGRLDREGANLRAALDRAAGAGDADLALALVNGLAWYWYLRGRFGEATRSLDAALAVPGPADPVARAEAVAWRAGMVMASGDGDDSERLRLEALRAYDGLDAPDSLARARVVWFLGHVHWPYGDLDANAERVAGALATFRARGDRWGTAAALSLRAKQAMVRGDLDGLARDGERSLRLFRELGDPWGRLEATDALGRHAEITGDYGRSAALRREALALAEELGLGAEAAFKLAELGRLALLTGDLERAGELHERAFRLAAALPSRSALEFSEIGLALVARRRGDLDAAERHLRARLGWLRDIGGRSGVAFVLAQLGFVAEQRGAAGRALELHREALDAARATGDPRAVALALEGIAGARAAAGHPAEAARLLGTAGGLRASIGAPLPPGERADVERIEAAARAALGDRVFDETFEGALGRGAEAWFNLDVSYPD
ncbi:BTAD domain-containing putative transcriptional regulator [Actinomadura rugatobispora]|uniref:BTAD domain-containing putative transcriptional regulator n=1 Tax=Actinomadura rugatobispora TaxID=1994 RepID=A0ABW1A2C5_9ACTN|nr:BTAD domain-containing putative transcriptional regulator [Actinomadura rugatobispora]